MSTNLDLTKLVPADAVHGEDADETELLKSMIFEAEAYLESHDWCPDIKDSFLGFGIGKVLAVVLVCFEEPLSSGDESLWCIVGDLPSAYLVTDDAPNAKRALEIYCELMEVWIKAASSGEGIEEAFPIEVEPTKKNADMLTSRVTFIREKILPSVE